MTIKTPAKINFGLSIGTKREDNYHPISTIFVPVTLYDLINLEVSDKPGINFTSNSRDIPNDSGNLCWKAADQFIKKAKISTGVTIDLEKNIPIEAGLGGGSSDAAAVLSGMYKLYPETLTKKEIFDIAANLGADVPFFLQDSACSANGIGEILQPVDFARIFQGFIVLVVPSFSMCSADAYAEFDRQISGRLAPVDYAEVLLTLGSIEDAKELVKNDFEPVLIPHYPEIDRIKQKLYETGAGYASLTGSGSVVYGMFLNEETAVKAEESFRESYRTEIVQPIS